LPYAYSSGNVPDPYNVTVASNEKVCNLFVISKSRQ